MTRSPGSPPLPAALLGALLLAAAPGAAGAQELRVRVRDGLGNPAVGARVALLGPDGAAAAEGIVGSLGRVRLPAPAGAYRVLVQQPGFADTIPATVSLAAGALDSIVVPAAGSRAAVPSALVARPDRCRSPGIPASLAALWQEVTKTLAIVALTERQHLADLSITAFTRALSGSLELRRESVNTLLAASNRPVAAGFEPAGPPGYLRREADSLHWAAPDVDTFLDPRFAATHCFGLVNGTGNRLGAVGLEFSPAADSVTDIEGTMWIDLARRELRVIEYRLTALPRDWRPERTGGAIEIHRMPPGFWITRFWSQRVPEVRLAEGRGRDRLTGFREAGAEVTALVPTIDTTDRLAAAQAIAERRAETRAQVARMEGVVVDTLGYPVEAAEVDVMGTEHHATTGVDGRFALDGIPPGMQIVRARKIGYKVQYFGIRLQGGQVADGRIALVREPQVLGEIVVTGRYGKPARYANTAKYDDFYRRRATHSGRFLTRDDIDRSAAGRISELLRAIPGVRVSFGTPGLGEEVSFLTCPPDNVSVWIDGQRLSGTPGELLPLIAPLDVEAIEVYQRQSIIPAQFRDNACAAIVMWTR